jgi:putative hydrolase of the HAD superfamily
VIEVVLFDLGGVLVDFQGVRVMHSLLANDDDGEPDRPDQLEDLWRRWIDSPAVRQFEKGLCPPREFAEGVVEEFGLPISAGEFEARFAGWIETLLPGALELLDWLPRTLTVGCLSNTNAVHWPRILGLGLDGRFDPAFVSHQLGCVKPDAELFAKVLERLDCAPERIVFFDDNQVNVDGARKAGLVAHLARGPADCRRYLESLLWTGPSDSL